MQFVLVLASGAGDVAVNAAVRVRVVSGHTIGALLVANTFAVVCGVEVFHLTPVKRPTALTVVAFVLVARPAGEVTVKGGHKHVWSKIVDAEDL